MDVLFIDTQEVTRRRKTDVVLLVKIQGSTNEEFKIWLYSEKIPKKWGPLTQHLGVQAYCKTYLIVGLITSELRVLGHDNKGIENLRIVKCQLSKVPQETWWSSQSECIRLRAVKGNTSWTEAGDIVVLQRWEVRRGFMGFWSTLKWFKVHLPRLRTDWNWGILFYATLGAMSTAKQGSWKEFWCLSKWTTYKLESCLPRWTHCSPK